MAADSFALPTDIPLVVVVVGFFAAIPLIVAASRVRRRPASHFFIWAVLAALPVLVSFALGADVDDAELMWMLAPHDQAALARGSLGLTQGALGAGAAVSALVFLVAAAALARSSFRAALDRRLGGGGVGAIALAAPVVMVAASSEIPGIPLQAVVVVAVVAGLAGLLVLVASLGGLARVPPAGGVHALIAVALFGAAAVLLVGAGLDASMRAGGPRSLFWMPVVATAVVVVAGGVAAWVRALSGGDKRIRGARHAPTPGLSQDLGDPETGGVGGVALAVVVVVAAVCGLFELRLERSSSALPEPTWPEGIEPAPVNAGDGRGADVVVAADGSFGALPADDDLPAVLIDRRAPRHATKPLFAALRERGFTQALIVGPRDDGVVGGVVVSTEVCLCEQRVEGLLPPRNDKPSSTQPD
ncbi:MAG: hypothetical protein Q8O67_07200 [Deltaproteobacteria bacterium]|nr:hypothetical protein [Deltaproteobacteria bacterium]